MMQTFLLLMEATFWALARFDHNIDLKSFHSPGQKFLNYAIVSYSLFKVLIIT